jgi:hypothetical protein
MMAEYFIVAVAGSGSCRGYIFGVEFGAAGGWLMSLVFDGVKKNRILGI